jgi:branched-chain amino acid transport system substrate-binding protein
MQGALKRERGHSIEKGGDMPSTKLVPILCLMVIALASMACRAAEPIAIGFSAALTGPLAVNGKPGLMAMQIWEEDTNAHGGLLGRPVKLVYYDDQSNPGNVPTIYSKLIEVDKVDFLVGTSTNLLAAALPIAMQHNKLLMGLLATGINDEYKYPRYFSMNPVGPEAKPALTRGFFQIAVEQKPKPETVAIVSSDAEYGKNCLEGAHVNADAAKLKIVFDRTYPPGGATDMAPIVRSMQASGADIAVVCSYPLESVAIIRAASEIGYTPKMFGGGMVGPQLTPLKQQLGPLLNGIMTFDIWLPTKSMQFPGVMEMLAKYQARAPGAGTDLLGYYIPPFSYANIQALGLAVAATGSLDSNKVAGYLHSATVETVIGPVAFGPVGEWKTERMLQVQYRNIHGSDLDELRDMSKVAILAPPQFKSGEVIYPYANAKR